jgi:hypothetical protein
VSATPNVTGNPNYFSYFLSAATNTALVNGTLYDFTIVATNAVGDSDPSDAGTAYASTSAFLNTIPTTGALSADLGVQGGALTCADPKSVNCKDITAQYAFSDTQHIGAIYNLDAEPNNSNSQTQVLQCLIVKSLDPGSFGGIVNSPDCGPSDKVIRATYPLSPNPSAPHLEQEQYDRSISTDTRGTPCFAYTVDNTGTAQCTDPALKTPYYTDPNTHKPTNFCPAQFDPSSRTGWTSAKPCAFVYYLVAAIPGFDIIGDSTHSINPRPVQCSPNGVGDCGKPAIIGSSIKNGITQGGTQLVQPWCDKALTYVPCVYKYLWRNGDSSSSPNLYDVVIQDYEVGDLLKGGSSG